MLGKEKQRSLLISYQLSTRSVWENHDRGREYKPNSVRSVHMRDRGQGSPIHTDKAQLIRCLLYGNETRTIQFLYSNWFVEN